MDTPECGAGGGAHRVTTYSVMKLTSELPRAHTRCLVAELTHV